LKLFVDRLVDNPVWLAPEIMRKEPYNEKVDTYAYGVILYELVEREQFFGSCGFFSDIQDFVIDSKRPTLSPDIPTDMKRIIEKCWHANQSERPQWEWVLQLLDLQKSQDEQIEANLGPKIKTKLSQKLKKIQLEAEEKLIQEKRIMNEQLLNEMTHAEEQAKLAAELKSRSSQKAAIKAQSKDKAENFVLFLQHDTNKKTFEELLTKVGAFHDYLFYREIINFKETIFPVQEALKKEVRAIATKYFGNVIYLKLTSLVLLDKIKSDIAANNITNKIFDEVIVYLENAIRNIYMHQFPKKTRRLTSKLDKVTMVAALQDSSGDKDKRKNRLWPRKKKG